MMLQTKAGGLTITAVLPNTPAAKAKLKVMDVITEINGTSALHAGRSTHFFLTLTCLHYYNLSILMLVFITGFYY